MTKTCDNPECGKTHDHIQYKHGFKVFCSIPCRDDYIAQLQRLAEAVNPFGTPLHRKLKKWYES